MDASTIVGSLAALCSMTSLVPQAWKVIRTRETKDLSPVMYALTVMGFAAWVTYGVLRGDWPLMVTNGVCLSLSTLIFGIVIWNKVRGTEL